ncbi:MAG: hypothetical protein AB1512_02475 [Thermodesulfobacteriota bacterium]
MQLMERVREYEFLGREFLLWVWFKSEVHGGRFPLGDAGDAELSVGGRIVLQSDAGEKAEKVICLGENSHLRQARFALTESKTVTEAMLKLAIGDQEWSFVLDSTWMNFKSFKAPKVMQDNEKDPEGLYYEKFLLIEEALSAMDSIYAAFLRIRLAPDWEAVEMPALVQWIKEGK